jgi:hypothetical protein
MASSIMAAGATSLMSTAAVSFVNNGGDIGQTLKDLGDKDNVKNIALAMVTAGALNGLNTSLGLDKVTVNDGFVANLNKAVINNLASAGINSALTGTDLEDNIKTGLINAVISAGAGQAAYEIGKLTIPGLDGQPPTLNAAGQVLAHALVGCMAGGAAGGRQGCESGALGAVVGELAGQWFDSDGSKNEAQVLGFVRVIAAAAGAITGDGSAQSVNIAADAGVNAVQNNMLATRDVKKLMEELDKCTGNQCDAIKRLYTGPMQTSTGGLEDLCKANPQACAGRLQDYVQALKEMQTPEFRALVGAETAKRLIDRQVADLDKVVSALKWGNEHAESSTQIAKAAMLVGVTAAGGGLMLTVGRAVVTACGSGVLSPACTGLMTELGIGVAEAASGVPVLGVSAPVAAAATIKLKQIAGTTTDAATVAKELQAIVGEAKASESARLLNNFYRDGAPPDLIQQTANAAAKNSTHNPLAPEVVLGRFVAGSADSYDEVAKARGSTYFSMSDWTAVQGQLGEEKMWRINQAFLDQQIAQGKQFLFTQDPRLANPKSYTYREYEHLTNNGFDIVKKGNSYVASPSKI